MCWKQKQGTLRMRGGPEKDRWVFYEGHKGASDVVGGVPEPRILPEGPQEVLGEVEGPLPAPHAVHHLQTPRPEPTAEAVPEPPLLGQVQVVVEPIFGVEEGEPAVVHPPLGVADHRAARVWDELGKVSHDESWSLGRTE